MIELKKNKKVSSFSYKNDIINQIIENKRHVFGKGNAAFV